MWAAIIIRPAANDNRLRGDHTRPAYFQVCGRDPSLVPRGGQTKMIIPHLIALVSGIVRSVVTSSSNSQLMTPRRPRQPARAWKKFL